MFSLPSAEFFLESGDGGAASGRGRVLGDVTPPLSLSGRMLFSGNVVQSAPEKSFRGALPDMVARIGGRCAPRT